MHAQDTLFSKIQGLLCKYPARHVLECIGTITVNNKLQPKFAVCLALQLASGSELAEVKRRVGVVKRVCRQRTLGAWKEWRTSMEQHRAAWLATHLHLLQQDHAHLHSGLDQVHQVQSHLQQLQTGFREGKAAQRAQQQASTDCSGGAAYTWICLQMLVQTS